MQRSKGRRRGNVFSVRLTDEERSAVEGLKALGGGPRAIGRVIALARPTWWALENPVGHLGRWLGTPRDVFQPCDFGDPWTKRTALWGDFVIPSRTCVAPAGGMPGHTPAARAVTPPSFAQAFFEANP